MLSILNSYETKHKRQILSADIDYYNRYVCTSSADGVIHMVDTLGSKHHSLVELKEHIGPVWQVMFSHPKFGYLASCGSDGKLILHKMKKLDQWYVVYKYDRHKLPTTSIDWAPYKTGAIIACSSSDGTISIHTLYSNEWSVSKIPNAHLNGVNCISWAPYLINNQLVLVSGGNDTKIKLWIEQKSVWYVMYESDSQLANIKDISWCPTPGLQKYIIASCTVDGQVIVWSSDDFYNWTTTEIDATEQNKSKVSWSQIGCILSVTMNNDGIKLWKQVGKQNWMCLDRKVTRKPQPSFEHQIKHSINTDIFSGIF
ncbi:Six-bladed beta-propeller, TolB-like,WD40 repeat,WD40-repeat-containing domain [Cinara cedri]|uniref:Protein SEC13 homolog n=1 Tax=Cinara cedri TaxID=506608 RepID=A0A5E4NBH1_9HEMI|nr:Six-bladed beta-propeller, TolB-like,WD40 repeat,WD40-repeat-containing domain [Cinara cedri]